MIKKKKTKSVKSKISISKDLIEYYVVHILLPMKIIISSKAKIVNNSNNKDLDVTKLHKAVVS